MPNKAYRPKQIRCVSCHTPIASFGERARAHVDVCGLCMSIARHDEQAIKRFRKEEGATDYDIGYVRMRVRSAVHYARLKRRGELVGIRVTRLDKTGARRPQAA